MVQYLVVRKYEIQGVTPANCSDSLLVDSVSRELCLNSVCSESIKYRRKDDSGKGQWEMGGGDGNVIRQKHSAFRS